MRPCIIVVCDLLIEGGIDTNRVLWRIDDGGEVKDAQGRELALGTRLKFMTPASMGSWEISAEERGLSKVLVRYSVRYL